MTRSFTACAVPAVIGMLALSACVSNPCDSGESDRCDGDVLWTCRADRDGHAVDYSWAIREDCGESARVCVSIGDSPESTDSDAFCAESSQPSQECDDLMPTGSFCDGDVFVSCYLGYVTSRRPCRVCENDMCTP